MVLSVSVRMFLDEINILIDRPSEADCSPQSGWASANLLEENLLSTCLQLGILSSPDFGLALDLEVIPLSDLALQVSNRRPGTSQPL